MVEKENDNKKLSASKEDYLEAVAVLKSEKVVVRVKDIGELLSVKPSSVTVALKSLSKDGYLIHEKYGFVELTAKGKKVANEIRERHKVLFEFLTTVLNIDNDVALVDAGRMEHSISSETLFRITKFIEFVNTCSDKGKPECLKNFRIYVNTGDRPGCEKKQE